jgi:hypothetical protein
VSERIVLSELSCRKGRESYTVSMRPRHGERVSFQTDGNLGHIMSGVSGLLRAIEVMQHGGTMKPVDILRGSITLDVFRIEPLITIPGWRLTMVSGPYRYDPMVEPDLELVILAFQGAMKFFSFKFGLTTLDAESVRNRDRAGEAGLLTQEDFPA